MPEIKKLDPFFERILSLEARGSDVARIMIVIPTILKPGQPFTATVSLLDSNAMPVFNGTESCLLQIGGLATLIPAFAENEAAVCQVTGIVLNECGFARLQSTYDDTTYYSNPALVTDDDRAQILWGDPHVHTTVGDCHAERCRTRNLAYTAARHVYGLNFIAIADHISWKPRGTPGKWYDNLAACELFNEPGEFSAIYCYEASLRGGHGGDNNVYMRDPHEMYVDPWPDEMHIGQLCEKIEGEFFVVPHHTTRTGKHGEIPQDIYPGQDLMPVVEIHSKWGCSEYRGNPNPLHSIHEGPSYAQDLLAQGHKLGFIGGTDSHTSMTFCQKLESEIHDRLPGMTAVIVKNNHRDEIYDAIKSQQCYAACGERTYLDATIIQQDDGSRKISVTAAGKSSIATVDVVCNGETVHTVSPDDWTAELEWVDERALIDIALTNPQTQELFSYYYVRVTTETEATAWSSPVWF